ncbi:MAG: hypothetical protein AAB456_02385 [Patescibacteria group bacterium]
MYYHVVGVGKNGFPGFLSSEMDWDECVAFMFDWLDGNNLEEGLTELSDEEKGLIEEEGSYQHSSGWGLYIVLEDD